ncbi:heparinase II/III family protein [Pseudogemmobacter bohemicus]|uniref:heparinase II/III family protein n=1 Tax=Pseudogemmobacter bohemicus TaxID=2250708 RepID=UPI000DD31438|nr:heparinase II/III family protein [Pseudogemmobacter bohemicus]
MTQASHTGSEAPSRRERLANRYAAWAARRAKPAGGFSLRPEPRSVGLYARGKQIMAGNIMLAGHLVEAGDSEIWDLAAPDPVFTDEAHGFSWLDDLAALGTSRARERARAWTQSWIRRFGEGSRPGWTPALTGRRVIRWIHHSDFLLEGEASGDEASGDRASAERARFFASLARQSGFLARRAASARPGLARIEALTGQVYAHLSLEEAAPKLAQALAALAKECDERIDRSGAITSRNPEELLEIFTLLGWAVQSLSDAGQPVPAGLAAAIDRVAPCLRALRHSDGGLARFHSGGTGAEGKLDLALAASKVLPPAGHVTLAMGYARLSAARTTVILDVAAPPDGPAAQTAHASTAAFELSSGRRPLIVNCGPGQSAGPEWRLAARATQSHSALSLTGFSSSRFGASSSSLTERAQVSDLHFAGSDGAFVRLSHDGWQAGHGLIATRELQLSPDGRRLNGTDLLSSTTPAARAQFGRMVERSPLGGLPFTIRFHLHPDVDASLDMGGAAVSMQLRSGEIWVFRHDSGADLSLEPSAWLERGRLAPRHAQQIVLMGFAQNYDNRIGWTLAKAQDTPLAIRDLDRDDPAPI